MTGSSARAEKPYTSRFAASMVEPSAAGVMAWATLTMPEPSREETAALIRLLRGRMRPDDVAELRRLGYPLD